jgi:uncharacterized membrane protein YtjA (UPF0391 family)
MAHLKILTDVIFWFKKCIIGMLNIIQNNTINYMLKWSLVFLIVAIIAGVLGFGALAGTAMTIAKILFVVFLVFFLIAVITGGVIGGGLAKMFKK